MDIQPNEDFILDAEDDLFYGDDIHLDDGNEGGDVIVVPKVDDIDGVRGYDNVRQALIRRLTTPQGALRRFIQDISGLKEINADYGNPAFRWLSEPLTPSIIAAIREDVMTCIAAENRVTLEDISTQVTTGTAGIRLLFNLVYGIVGEEAAGYTLVLAVDGQQITLAF